ncbi:MULTISPECIES: hypothetical protein [Actinoplanes]|uniref:hypothetical protein n=1 Tax=Actinoplanes TaxID=1865 RepID=UPI000ACC7D97|nr:MULTISPECIES: hypothetical protein [Actinoplanes]GLY05820.1 hypothetical protein Acsp01_61990 [Actinoplanes sp. NBRC 101535]
MRLRALFSRLALPVVASGLAVTGLTLPAQAEEPSELELPYAALLTPETVTVINGQSKTVKVEVYNVSSVAAKNVVVTFGAAGKPVDADLGFTPPEGCSATSCTIDNLKVNGRRTLSFTLKPSGAEGAPVAALPIAVSVGGNLTDEVEMGVVRTAKGGVDIEVDAIKDITLGRGRTADVPVIVRNTGDKPVKALGLVVYSVEGVEPVLKYRNCMRDEEFGAYVCVVNEPLEAGGVFTLPSATPLRVAVGKDTPGPFEYPVYVAAVGLTDEFVFDFAKDTANAAGAELKLEAAASSFDDLDDLPADVEDLNPDDNTAFFAVSVPKSSADSAAIGGVFAGAPGESRKVKVGVVNNGPTATLPLSMDMLQYVRVTVPDGVDLTAVDERCLPGTSPENIDVDVDLTTGVIEARDFVCLVLDSLTPDKKVLFTFEGDLNEEGTTAGFVKVNGGPQDSKHGNDKAALTVKLNAGGSGGGGLPVTGANAGAVAGGGALLLVAGFLAYRMARRRKFVTVAE